MKKHEWLNIFVGILLILFAAFFSISLLVQFFNIGNNSSKFAFFIFSLGHILVSVYGYCSILIPLFLLVTSLFSFATGWTLKNGISLFFSFFPFFTAVLTERLCALMTEYETGPLLAIKIACTILIGVFLIVIEYLFFGILGQKLYFKLENNSQQKLSSAKEIFSNLKNREKVKLEEKSLEKNEEENKNASLKENLEPQIKISPVFEHIFDKVAEKQTSVDSNIESTEEIENNSENKTQAFNNKLEDTKENQDDSQSLNVTPLITKEEYDALLEPFSDDENSEENINNLEDNVLTNQTEHFSNTEEEIVENSELCEVSSTETDDSYKNTDNEENLSVIKDAEENATILESSTLNLSNENRLENIEEYKSFTEDVNTLENSEDDFSIASINFKNQSKDNKFFEEKDENEKYIDNFNTENSDEEFEADDEFEEDDNYLESAEKIDTFQTESFSTKPFSIREYKIPVENILLKYEDDPYWIIDEETKNDAILLKSTLSEFKIDAEVIGIRKGPVVTMFEMLPAPGVKLSKIVTLQDNIALRLAASSVRIVAPIPGKQAVGIEVPNKNRSIVSFREIIEKDLIEYKKMAVPVILGKDIEGEPQLMDLVKTPHLLIAGATGAGKSVCVNSMILSILYKRSPQQVKLILIDPKIVELKLYNDIPHLLTPVITEPKKAFQALQYCLCEMERRYALLDGMGVRDISSYNKRIVERHIATEKLPYIVVIIDEFADLMATTGKELESTVARLAAMSRAIGIHIVLATQRPSIDVITGLIKANIPTRIAFMVASKMDSRIIIDQVGAEKLLGRGDMLYASAVDPFPIRIQGTFVNDNEVENVVNYVKQYGMPDYIDDEIFVDDEDEEDDSISLFDEGEDPLYNKALEVVLQAGKASASYIQRRLKIGYNRAARLVEDMEKRGIVGPQNGSKPREIIHVP